MSRETLHGGALVQGEINNSLDELEMERRKVSKKDELADDRLEPIDLRTAACVLAIGRVAQVAMDRGIWP